MLVVVTFVFCVAVSVVNVVNVVTVLNGFVATVFAVLVVFNGVFCLVVFGSSGHDCLHVVSYLSQLGRAVLAPQFCHTYKRMAICLYKIIAHPYSHPLNRPLK